MFALILTTHIVALSLSIVTTIVLLFMVIFGRSIKQVIRKTNLIVTSLGIALGIGMLIVAPVGSRCLELSAYLAIFSAAYVYIERRSKVLTARRQTLSE